MFVSYYSVISSRPRMEKIVLSNCIGDSTLESRYQTSRVLVDRKTEFKDVSKATYDEFLSYYSENFFLEKYFNSKQITRRFPFQKYISQILLSWLQFDMHYFKPYIALNIIITSNSKTKYFNKLYLDEDS